MACFHPYKGFPAGLTKDAKVKLRITPYSIAGLDSKGEPVSKFGLDENSTTSYYEIPCGKCAGCRADQAKDWSNRLIMEMQYHDSAYFITLTYNELMMHRVPRVNDMTGEVVYDRGTLDKRDIQLFMKRLRKARPDDNIRYYICGEYGPQTDRPHYHGIIYGLHMNDWILEPCGKSETGNQYYTCSALESIWRNGFISIEPANEYTCKYVTNYVTKKLGADNAEERRAKGQEPQFALQSRRPGIGRQFYEERGEELMQTDVIYIPTANGSVSLTPPRYFRKLYRDDQPEKAERLAERHLKALEDNDDALIDLTDLDKEAQLIAKENTFKKSLGLRNKI